VFTVASSLRRAIRFCYFLTHRQLTVAITFDAMQERQILLMQRLTPKALNSVIRTVCQSQHMERHQAARTQ